jgi:hypothetical protein
MEKSCANCRHEYRASYCIDCKNFDRYLPDYETLESQLEQSKELLDIIRDIQAVITKYDPVSAVGIIEKRLGLK